MTGWASAPLNREALTRTLTSGLCTHEFLERCIVGEVHPGLYALTAEDRDRRRALGGNATLYLQKCTESLLDRNLQGLTHGDGMDLDRSQQFIVDVDGRAHVWNHIGRQVPLQPRVRSAPLASGCIGLGKRCGRVPSPLHVRLAALSTAAASGVRCFERPVTRAHGHHRAVAGGVVKEPGARVAYRPRQRGPASQTGALVQGFPSSILSTVPGRAAVAQPGRMDKDTTGQPVASLRQRSGRATVAQLTPRVNGVTACPPLQRIGSATSKEGT